MVWMQKLVEGCSFLRACNESLMGCSPRVRDKLMWFSLTLWSETLFLGASVQIALVRVADLGSFPHDV